MQEEKIFAIVEECLATTQNNDTWMIDNGCTHHMSINLKCFKTLDKAYTSKVKLGDGRLVDVEGKGVVVVQTHLGTKLIFNVLFAPKIKYNLLSVG